MKVGSVKSKYIYNSSRLNSDFHLTQGVIYDRFLRQRNHRTLGDLTTEIFCAGRSKRIYVEEQGGIPYLGNTDISSIDPFIGCNYASKKFWREKKGLLKEGMILTGRVGQNTVGAYSYASKELEGSIGSDNVIRIISNGKVKNGYLFSFLASKYGYHLSRRHISGNAQPFVTEDMLADLPVPILSELKQQEIHNLIIKASELRVEANELLRQTRINLKEIAGLKKLNPRDFEHFGSHSYERTTSTFRRSINEISSISFNAFNYSKRVEILENLVRSKSYLPLFACLDNNQFFSSGSFKRLELDSPSSIRLLNQSDIFNLRKQGKLIAKLYAKADKLVEYGEVLIAGVGTLGEGETFCRAIFASEELEGQLISGEFIRMKTNDKVPSGYLYAWLSSDYGFRFIRKTQTGTKLCRPIQELLKNVPVPIIDKEEMIKIDEQVKKAHTMLFEALNAENEAIELVENEIESWQKS